MANEKKKHTIKNTTTTILNFYLNEELSPTGTKKLYTIKAGESLEVDDGEFKALQSIPGFAHRLSGQVKYSRNYQNDLVVV